MTRLYGKKMDSGVLVFLGSKNITSGNHFETHQLRFIKNFYSFKLADFSRVIITLFVPKKINAGVRKLINEKEKIIIALSKKYRFKYELLLINEKKIISIFSTYTCLHNKIKRYKNIFIFAQNYFSGLIGMMLKYRIKRSYFHLNLRGVPAEEELFYSN